jgi:predicted MPP superfamily phosphohydrolase
VLSGHTHGGQIRAFGHTFAEPVMHHAYMLGAFERNGSRLYVSSGFGHWLPVRIGCPAEAPILRLDPLPPQADPRA